MAEGPRGYRPALVGIRSAKLTGLRTWASQEERPAGGIVGADACHLSASRTSWPIGPGDRVPVGNRVASAG